MVALCMVEIFILLIALSIISNSICNDGLGYLWILVD